REGPAVALRSSSAAVLTGGNHSCEGCVRLGVHTCDRGQERKDPMSTLKCPHCKKPIELIGQKELTEEYGLGPNPVAHLRSLGSFPEPALSFGNRNMWYREVIEEFMEVRRQTKVAQLVEDMRETLAALPETERDEALKMLDTGTPRKKAH